MTPKNKKIPLLLIIPHGGYEVPEELSQISGATPFELFMGADTCANELFALENHITAKIDSTISRFFIDMDRSYKEISQSHGDGVIKRTSSQGSPLFRKKCFPDDLAIANMLRRYYFPFHRTIENICATGEIALIVECHTMMPLSAEGPRPLVAVENRVFSGEEELLTAPPPLGEFLTDHFKKSFAKEEGTIGEKCQLNPPLPGGIILEKYGLSSIPMLRLSVSKALFINEAHFNHDFLRVDELRIASLRERLWKGLEAATAMAQKL